MEVNKLRINAAAWLKYGAACLLVILASPAAAQSLNLPWLSASANASYASDLKFLVLAVGLTIVQMLIAVSGATLQVGLPKILSNRDPAPIWTGWVGRAMRAHHNMLENLPLFAILVLIEPVTFALTKGTAGIGALGAPLFFYGRLAYSVIYIAGIPGLRTLSWTVGLVGIILLLLQALPIVSM